MGLLHIHKGRTDLFTPTDGLSGGVVSSLLEDREGNVWVATTDGLDVFRIRHPDNVSPARFVQPGRCLHFGREGWQYVAGRVQWLNRWNKGRLRFCANGACVAGAFIRRSADSPPDHVRSREPPFGRLPRMDCRKEGSIPSLRTNEGKSGPERSVESPLGSDSFPRRIVPSGIVFSIAGDHAGNISISRRKGFQLFQARVVERGPWANSGAENRRVLYCMIPSRVVLARIP